MEIEQELKKALAELRKNKERKFDQTADLIVNLQKFNPKKDAVNILVNLPNKIRDKKVAGFFEVRAKNIETITPNDFKKYSDKKEMKKLVKKYDFFISQSSLMPKVATAFGRILGPAGKMPSPQLGILMNPDDKTIEELIKKISNSFKIKTIDNSIKMAIGKQSMSDENIIENIMVVFNSLVKALPRDKENIKNIEVKFTMTKPIRIEVK